MCGTLGRRLEEAVLREARIIRALQRLDMKWPITSSPLASLYLTVFSGDAGKPGSVSSRSNSDPVVWKYDALALRQNLGFTDLTWKLALIFFHDMWKKTSMQGGFNSNFITIITNTYCTPGLAKHFIYKVSFNLIFPIIQRGRYFYPCYLEEDAKV